MSSTLVGDQRGAGLLRLGLNVITDFYVWFVRDARGWRRYVTSFLAGVVSVLALAPFQLWFIPFLTFPILVWLIDGVNEGGARQSFWDAAKIGWWFGFGYFLVGLYWVGGAFLVEADRFAWLLPFAVTILPAGLSLFFGVAAGVATVVSRPGMPRVVALILCLSFAEWVRGHILTGFPWNCIGYMIAGNDVLLQSASIVGVYGLGLLGLLIYTAPALVFVARAKVSADGGRERSPGVSGLVSKHNLHILGVGTVFVAMVVFGLARLDGESPDMVEGVKLRVVQPNIDQVEKWRADKRLEIFNRYLDLSQRNEAFEKTGLKEVTHLIWPESAVPFLLARAEDAKGALAQILPDNVTFMTGALRLAETKSAEGTVSRRFYNSFFVMDADMRMLRIYDKVHLVPFGEYLPFQNTLEAVGLEQITRIRGGFAPGKDLGSISLPDVPRFNVLICYEVGFSGHVADPVSRPGWLVNVTNDAWFGVSSGPYQHLHQARVRAVEEGLPVIRAANTGISAIIDPFGRVLTSIDLGTKGVLDSGLPEQLSATIFSKQGDNIFFCMFTFLFLWFLVFSKVQIKNAMLRFLLS